MFECSEGYIFALFIQIDISVMQWPEKNMQKNDYVFGCNVCGFIDVLIVVFWVVG